MSVLLFRRSSTSNTIDTAFKRLLLLSSSSSSTTVNNGNNKARTRIVSSCSNYTTETHSSTLERQQEDLAEAIIPSSIIARKRIIGDDSLLLVGINKSDTTRTSSLVRGFSTATTNNEDDDDDDLSIGDLCQKHLELPAVEFALGCSLLHQIALGTTPADLGLVLSKKPSLANFQDYDRRSPLHMAASEGHVDLCRALVDTYGAQINRSDRWGGSPLDDAHRHRHTDVVDFLTSRGGTFGSPSCASNFITSASEGDLEEIKAIWEFGKSSSLLLNKGDYDHRTALHLAARRGRVEICEFLCKVGADVNAQDRWGNRPLDDAQQAADGKVVNHAEECVRILKKHGAKSNNYHNNCYNNDQEVLLDLMQQYGKIRDTTTNNWKNATLTMDCHDVKNMLEGIGEEPTDEMVQKLFEVADLDRDGFIDTKDFMENSTTFLGGRPARIILVVGGPGSGKGVLSERLMKECGMVHLSSGDLLRKEVAEGTCLGNQVQDIMTSGELVSSAIMVTLMKKQMRNHPGKRILLDGFPRSAENAKDLVTLCGQPELALHIDCDDTILLERIMKRGADKETTRSDDNFVTALQRIRSFHKYHTVTMDFLREQHVPIVYLDGAASAQGVWQQLLAIGRMMRSAVKLPRRL